MSEELKEGDVVELNSGSPHMTIDKIAVFSMGGTQKEARCVWFDGKKRMVELFELHALKKVQAHEPAPRIDTRPY